MKIPTLRHALLVAALLVAAGIGALVTMVGRSIGPWAGPHPDPALAVCLPVKSGNGAGALTITVNGLRDTRGTVLIGLYDSRETFERAIRLASDIGFLNDPNRVAGAALRANELLRGGISFRNLPSGRYAVILFHDENSNGRLDRNFWGVPTEPYGFSDNAQGTLGPPSFEEAAVTLNGGDQAISIDLVYHGGGIRLPDEGEGTSSSTSTRQ